MKKREGVGEEGIAFNESQTFYRDPFVYERGTMEHVDWLRARQSKKGRVLTETEEKCIVNIGFLFRSSMAEVEEESFELAIQATLKVLAQNRSERQPVTE